MSNVATLAAIDNAAIGFRSTPIPFEWAADLRSQDDEAREIVQGMLTAGGMSMVYGESNSGKSYLATNLAFSMSSGKPWLGKHTERGAVVYVAGEGAASIRRRVRAHESHYGESVGAFGLIPQALSLMDPGVDVEDLIALVQAKESEIGEKVLLIIVDTVARAMGGGNENASEDMARLIRAGDRIREKTDAHIMWIHHSGKDQAKGARGHSSLRAALDTEMEVTADESTHIHTLTVTKQRDLSTKGERIAGRFVCVDLGEGQWGDRITACAVESTQAAAPVKKMPRLGEAQQSILALLRGAEKDMRVREVAEMLEEQFSKSSVYNAASRLKDLALVEISGGLMHLVKS